MKGLIWVELGASNAFPALWIQHIRWQALRQAKATLTASSQAPLVEAVFRA